MATSSYTTLSYKHLPKDKEVLLDFYPPEKSGSPLLATKIPAVVFFHVGGLIMGNRRILFPAWLQSMYIFQCLNILSEIDVLLGCLERANALGYAFISADYQLLLPTTGHDALSDVQDLFKFITENNFTHRKATFEIDPEKIIVAGASIGGNLAYLAAAHVSPFKPKGILSFYGMGGDYFASDNSA